MEKQKLLIILTGKTASGKDTVMNLLLEKFPELKRVITTTSRPPRKGETEGTDYYFISAEEFQSKISAVDFIEFVQYGGNFYGTQKSELTGTQNLIWRIDPSMAGKVKQQPLGYRLLVIYLTVDDAVVLERLHLRGLSDLEIEKRMQDDRRFWEEYKDNYDYVIENVPGKLDETVDKIIKLI